MFSRVNFSKVHTFWEGHKNVHISWISGELCPFSSQNLFTLCIMKNCLYKKLIRRTMWDLCTIDWQKEDAANFESQNFEGP